MGKIEQKRKEAGILRRCGYPYSEIAGVLGISTSSAWNYARDGGRRDGKAWPPSMREKVKELRSKGTAIHRLAKMLGIPYTSAYRIIHCGRKRSDPFYEQV